MLMPDVNVLVYAHRQDEAWHEPYADWLRRTVDGPNRSPSAFWWPWASCGS